MGWPDNYVFGFAFFKSNLIGTEHENRFSNCLLAIENNSLIFECDAYEVVSSANDKILL